LIKGTGTYLKLGGINLCVDRVLEIAKTITTVRLRLPDSGQTIEKTMLLTAVERRK